MSRIIEVAEDQIIRLNEDIKEYREAIRQPNSLHQDMNHNNYLIEIEKLEALIKAFEWMIKVAKEENL